MCTCRTTIPISDLIEIRLPSVNAIFLYDKECNLHGVKEIEVRLMKEIYRRVWVNVNEAAFIKQKYDVVKLIEKAADGKTALIEFLDYEFF